ncbi:MAG: NTP transferase domain-containing protein [Microbacteriaceae bacterium]|jgi:choline kinase|nr:NTP transferase domain-containing protein [Microbacteriaceae bacterium]MCI1207118.1 NTP transferase domain-containing protein [Microbacteriaceae bacterium]
MTIQATILAAGMGTRLGRPYPKSLTHLSDGRTIMGQQHDNIATAFGDDVRLVTVVGFKLEAIIESFPDSAFVYNELFDQTNTSKSLLKGLHAHGEGGVLWMNGDVVFDPEILRRVKPLIEADQSFCVVNTSEVADEEVKYTVSADGGLSAISKRVPTGIAEGEAVGINFVSSTDRELLVHGLELVDDQEYFEGGIEWAISQGARFLPVDVSDLSAVEVDFPDDLARANREFAPQILDEEPIAVSA